MGLGPERVGVAVNKSVAEMTKGSHTIVRLEGDVQSPRAWNPRARRSEIGQFFTPPSIARFMASLFSQRCEHTRILDAGAGAGTLFEALVDALNARAHPPQSIDVTAYENDRAILPQLDETMSRCRMACEKLGVRFSGSAVAEDFISAGLSEADDSLFRKASGAYTHAILNPPYKKINGETRARKLLNAMGMEVSNLYAAFVWLAAHMLKPGGEMVAITPRSFCNGPYFRRFRVAFLDLMDLRRIHVFESRKKPFCDDDVLQENVIIHAIRGERRSRRVVISASEDATFCPIASHSVPYERVVSPNCPDRFIYLIASSEDNRTRRQMSRFHASLDDLGLEVSTGRVVDFRASGYLRAGPGGDTVPLIYPCHFREGFVEWPAKSAKKPNAIVSSPLTRNLLVEAGYYVLTKRFSAKEEQRRIVAAIYDPHRVHGTWVGFENHLNYFHSKGEGLPPNLAKGLAVYLNSSLFDRYFRLFSGHTQVNATDLRKTPYPSREELLRLGSHVGPRMPDQETVDKILETECGTDG